MDFLQNPEYKPVTREELVKMKKVVEEKEINNIIEKIVKQFYHLALLQAKGTEDTTFEFNITDYYLSYCNPDKTHELLNVAFPPEADRTDIDRGQFYISMVKKFIDDNEDKIIIKLFYYFPDCNFEIKPKLYQHTFHGAQRILNAKIIIMEWVKKQDLWVTRAPPPTIYRID